MTMWMNRAGRHGESEATFLNEGRIYLQWEEITEDLSKLDDKVSLRDLLQRTYPSAPEARIRSFLGQIWSFAKLMQSGDLVALPSKLKPAIHFGEITGPYQFDTNAEPQLRQYRSVNWFATDIPRSSFSQDILYGFGPQTICRVKAEDRIRKTLHGRSSPDRLMPSSENIAIVSAIGDEAELTRIDIEESARDEIALLIGRKYKGHAMARLVEQILNAQGYTTHRSPEGPDYGIDIMAAPGSLGFGQPRMVVQVKSSESPTDRVAIDQLIGTMQNVHAEHGLFVSWGGFKASVDREKARQFFRVRLWDQQALIDQVLESYEKLDDDLRAELPLKKIWVVAQPDESDDS